MDSAPTSSTGFQRLASVSSDLHSWQSLLVLLIATLGMLVPFLDKPFHIDDPLFVWAAKHIRENVDAGRNPADFFGFDVNWSGSIEKMHVVTQNPPLACYALAAASFVTGWDERGLHAVFLIPAIGVVLGTWFLARRLTGRPVFAALVVVVSPVFIVSSTNVMCDTLMCCLWVWSIVLWLTGLDRGSHWRLAASAVLITLTGLTKYFGLCLMPLLTLYTLARSLRHWPNLLWLLIPVAGMWGYQEWTRHLYGHGMLSGAAEYAATCYRQAASQHLSIKPIATLAFTGGCVLCILFFAPSLLRNPWPLVRGLVIAVSLAVWLYRRNFKYLQPISVNGVRHATWDITVQVGLLVALGIAVVELILADLRESWRSEDGSRSSPEWREGFADSLLLGAWAGGTIVFTGYVNWTVNGRSVLPLIPAAAILIARRMDWNLRAYRPAASAIWPVFRPLSRAWYKLFKAPPAAWQWLPLIPAAALTWLVADADYQLAKSQRQVAEEICSIARRMPGIETEPGKVTARKLWYVGHWGFQYYMDQGGATAVAFHGPTLSKGDLFVIPFDNTSNANPSGDNSEIIRALKQQLSPWAATHSRPRRAAFYSDRWGALPFIFGREYQPDPELAEKTRDNDKDTYYLLVLTRHLTTDTMHPEEQGEDLGE